MKKLRNNKIRKLLAFMVALALMVSCMPSAYTISASEAFGDGTEDIFTDGEFTSEPAAEESTPDVSSADQEETEQAQQSTLTYENDSVKVTAEALEDGALPQNTALKADSVNENSSVSYDTVSQKLSAAATDKGSSLRGFFAYDVYFADGDGNRVEPNGRVRVTFEYKTPAAPELTDAASTSVTVEKLHYNSSTGDTDVNTLQANEDLKVLNVNEGKQIQTLQVETGNAAVFAVMWDSPETAAVEAEAVSGNEDEVSIASEELTDGMDISDEPEQDAAETPAAENPEVTPEAEPSEEPAVEPTEAPAENPDAEPTEAPAENPDVVEEPAEDIESPEDVPAADENGETSLIEVLGDDTNLRVSPSIEAEVLATVNAGTQLTLLDTVTAEDGATWYKVSWEGTEAYIRSDMAQVVDSSDEAEEVEDVLESEEVSYTQVVGDVVVTATAARGVIPEDAQFVVNPIEKDSDQYADVADRLEKKAENEEYSIAGFLAYDIYFQDSEGNKINPEDGKVKVSMEYQNATAPDEVKEADVATMAMASADENSQDDTETAEQNISVSVMHFVEDENGNVESVVDMTKDDTANVETNAEGEVQKAEFETESFSTFTITWKNYNNTKLKVKLVDTAGNPIGQDTEFNAPSAEVNVSNIAPEVDGYVFNSAKLGKYDSSTTIQKFKVNWSYYSRYYYITYSSGDNQWYRIGSSEVYFVYEKQSSLTYVNTVDSKSKGINMKMIDYDGQQFGGHTWNDDQKGGKEVKQGILSKTLGADGYPKFITNYSTNKNGGLLNNQSLKQFYDGATDVNHLFLEDVYNSDGKYFYYNSEENGASLNSADESGVRDFSVFKELTTPKNESAPIYKRGNFLPYDTFLKKTKSTNTNLYDSSGNPIPSSSKRHDEPLYLPDKGDKNANYYFGMEMDAKFIQGKNGYYDENPMKYEFTGDDDLWVYIDGVLVLDMGGCHDARSGYIDFSNGKVVVENQVSRNKETTLQECFRAAEKYNEADWKDNGTFKDYTSHTIKMFYMERGAGASNLKIKFNLPTVPKGQVKVTKELSNTDKKKYANVDFYFQMYAQKKQEDGTYSNDEYELLGRENSNAVKEGSGEGLTFRNGITFEGDKKTYNNVFCLKAGETALFNNLDANRKYYVQEIGVKSSEYDKVTINTTEKTTEKGTAIESEKASVDERQMITFTNNCTVANSRELRITKRIKNNLSVGDDKFDFKILLSDQSGNNLIPYANGDYYLEDDDGNYYYNNENGLTSNGKNPKVCGKTSNEGIVTGVPDGYTVVVKQILSGTSFEVEEVNLDQNKYNSPEKSVNNTDETDITESSVTTEDGKITADGKIALEKDASVIITNNPVNHDTPVDETFIKVSKTFNGLTEEQINELAAKGYKITIAGSRKDSTGSLTAFSKELKLSEAVNKEGNDTTWTYTWKINGCGTGKYTVTETGYDKAGYSTGVEINGKLFNGQGIEVQTVESEYRYDSGAKITSCNQQDYTIGKQNLIIAKLTQGEGTFVWTKNPASVNERLAIIKIIKNLNFDKKASLDNCYFYSGNGSDGTFIFRNAMIKYDGNNKLHFDYPKQWAMFGYGTYTITSSQNAEVEITNTYTEQTVDLDVIKTLPDGTELSGAEFYLYKKDGNEYKKVHDDSFSVDNMSQEQALQGLNAGQYCLEECKAPTGCSLLADKIYFKQENQTITLTDENGSPLEQRPNMYMWSLSSENNKFVLTIKNNKIYELPNSGGPGTYGFTISGVAILATALLLFINNKRREEEAKRS